MTDPIRPRIDFDSPLDTPAEPPLRAARHFTDNVSEAFIPQSTEAQDNDSGKPEALITYALTPKRSLWRRMVVAGAGLLLLSSIAQGIGAFVSAWQHQQWFSLGALTAGGIFILAAVGAIGGEWRRLYRLRERVTQRSRAADLPKLVQPVIDRQVRLTISRFAAESTLLVAVSPLALVDMSFIAWRNFRLVNRIAALYGIDLSYFSRIRLFRLVLVNIAFAGISEWVREIGMDSVSQDLTARLSARAAQGMGAGLLTARLGLKAMELCRPLPWLPGEKPRLGEFRRELLGQLKAALDKRQSPG
ncbi:YcjF family protein [Candidatus Sodalis sp. SoCistrobi]|uniref:YcjF family protein n=1 Tax=Candidatus Sodalis sp. SoCistrobi TaxID=1922216 RepID=UPI00093FBD6B|nr:TIGR01620 family protein [Candidatus Sodalis sp. SoCistrobi]